MKERKKQVSSVNLHQVAVISHIFVEAVVGKFREEDMASRLRINNLRSTLPKIRESDC